MKFGNAIRSRLGTIVLLSAVCLGVFGTAQAQVPTLYYDFENNATRTTFENLVEQSINAGSGAITRAGGTTTISAVSGAGSFNGGGASGQAATSNTWSASTTDPGNAATDYYQFVVNTSEFSGISITFDDQASGTGPARVGILYSTNGTTFTATTTNLTGNAAFGARSFNLSAITAIDNQASVTIRVYAYAGSAGDRTGRSAFASGGTYRIDNLMVRATGITASKTLLNHDNIGLSIRSGTAFNPVYNALSVTGAGVVATLSSSVNLASGSTVSVGSGGSIATGGSTLTITPGGIFRINEGGFVTGATGLSYGVNATLAFANTSGSYGVNNDPYWPTSNGPTNVVVMGSGGITMNVSRTVSGILEVRAGVAGSTITVNGTCALYPGGFFSTSPTYGPSSTLLYNTNYGVSNEWTGSGAGAGGARAAGLGQPQNVQLNTGTLTLDGNPRALPGNLTWFNSGTGLTLASGGDLAIGGNWSRTSGTTFTHNNVGVWFIGSTNQTVFLSGGPETFGYLLVNKSGGDLQATGSVTVTGAAGDALQLSGGDVDLGANTLTMSGGGNFRVTGARTIKGNSNAQLKLTAYISVTGPGSLSIFPTNSPTTIISAGVNFFSTTLNGTLQIDPGGFINTNPPTYGSGSTLKYNVPAGFFVNHDWNNSGTTAGPGVPQNVQVLQGTVTLPNAANRTVPGNLDLIGTSSMVLQGGGTLTVNGQTQLNNGKITTSTGKFIVPSGGSLLRGTGFIAGNLQKFVPTGGSVVRTFEVGEGSAYTPVELTFASVTGSGSVTGSAAQILVPPASGAPPAGSGIHQSKYVGRSWSLTNGGVTFTTYDPKFTFLGGDVQGGANTNNFIVAKNDGGTWSHPTVGTKTATTTQATGLNSFSDFSIGESVTNTVNAVSPTACVTTANSCQTVPVNISRTDMTGLRLFSVTFQLSPELQLCGTPAASILEGTYLSGFNTNTTFLITNNGGGSYTADGTINGGPCGATAASGNLFNIQVTNSGGSGTGLVTITNLVLRDCSNNTLTSTIGTVASVPIDLTPVTVAAISSPQTVVENSLLTITPSATLSSCASGPVTWSVSPALPAGASFNTSNGVITWTPACGTAGSYGPFTLTATAASGDAGSSNAFTIQVNHLVGTVTVAAISSPQTVTEQSLLTITPSASTTPCAALPLTWSVSPALPSGATFSTSSGQITWTPACGTAGSYGPFTLTATAATGEVGNGNAFTIQVNHLVGTVTVAAISSPQIVTEQSLLTITPSASTTPCAAGPLTWSVSPALPSGATFSTSSGQITWTPVCGTAGNYGPFTLTATASTGEVGNSNAFTIQVNHLVGTVTVAAISSPQTVTEQSLLTITPSSSTTPCTGTLTWSVSPALPSGASLNTGNGEITWTPACGTAGSYGPFTLTATASTGEVGNSNAFTIQVNHLVGTVTVNAISTPQTVTEQSLLTITPSSSTTPCAGTLTWSVSPALPSGASLNTGNGEITWTPACGTAGSYGPFTLTATASTGEVGNSNAFTIQVNHLVGTVTVAAISSPQTVTEQSLLTITPSASTTPCAAGPLTWSVSPALPSGATFSTSSGQITWTPACGTAGSYGPFTLTATASTGEVGNSNAFTIQVNHLVGTVTVAAISSPQTVTEQSLLTITPSASTTPCAAGPLTWSVSPALPSGATFSTSSGQITWTPACGTAGSYGPFTLTATASTGEVGNSNAFTIQVDHLVGTVTVNAISTPQTVVENSLLTITPSASTTPCAGGPLTWSVSPALPSGATFSTSSGQITWTPACGTAGSYGPFTLTATATTGEAGNSNAFTIQVNHLVGTVTVNAISTPQTVVENSLLTITPSASTTPCAGTLTWSVSPALPSGASLNTGSGEITWTPACGTTGSYGPFTLTATASTGEVGNSNGFTINVTHLTGTVAIAAITTPQTVAEGSMLTITPSASTTPCAGAPLTWSVSPALPAGASFSTSSGVITWTPSCTQAGSYGPFTLTATAATGEVGSSNAFTINVTDVLVAIGPIANLSATQVTSGNDADGTTKVTLAFTLPGGATSVEVYRAGFGSYPEYDDALGSVPGVPSYPPSSPWALTSVTASGQTDEPATRDYYYYVAFVKNACGDVSTNSNVAGGVLNYHLGDVTPGVGDNVVNIYDVSVLGAHYGVGVTAGFEYLDVGPTTTMYVDGRPTTDNLINFEDLVMFAINYEVVSGPILPKLVPGGTDVLSLSITESAPDQVVAHVYLNGTGVIQALSTKLKWNAAVLQPVGFAAGQWLSNQNGVAMSSQPGSVDAALLGVRGQGMAGAGEVATITFRRIAAGNANLAFDTAIARNALNVNVPVSTSGTVDVAKVIPTRTSFAAPSPNPFREGSVLTFGLAQPGNVALEIFSVDGARVRSLVKGAREAGEYRVKWDGRNEHGMPVNAGVYYARLSTGQGQFRRSVVYLR